MIIIIICVRKCFFTLRIRVAAGVNANLIYENVYHLYGASALQCL
jgi:hypothetical protein